MYSLTLYCLLSNQQSVLSDLLINKVIINILKIVIKLEIDVYLMLIVIQCTYYRMLLNI